MLVKKRRKPLHDARASAGHIKGNLTVARSSDRSMVDSE